MSHLQGECETDILNAGRGSCLLLALFNTFTAQTCSSHTCRAAVDVAVQCVEEDWCEQLTAAAGALAEAA